MYFSLGAAVWVLLSSTVFLDSLERTLGISMHDSGSLQLRGPRPGRPALLRQLQGHVPGTPQGCRRGAGQRGSWQHHTHDTRQRATLHVCMHPHVTHLGTSSSKHSHTHAYTLPTCAHSHLGMHTPHTAIHSHMHTYLHMYVHAGFAGPGEQEGTFPTHQEHGTDVEGSFALSASTTGGLKWAPQSWPVPPC